MGREGYHWASCLACAMTLASNVNTSSTLSMSIESCLPESKEEGLGYDPKIWTNNTNLAGDDSRSRNVASVTHSRIDAAPPIISVVSVAKRSSTKTSLQRQIHPL